MASSVNAWWTPLQEGDRDPHFVRINDRPSNWCNIVSPRDSWYCSRPPGHPGPHVASDESVVLEVWGESLTPELMLPEGF